MARLLSIRSASASQPILRSMRPALTDRPFVDEVPRLLGERGLSIRALARAVGVTDSHLSRVMRHANYKTPSPKLARRVATALGLPPDYFPEYRKGFVLERIRTDAVLRDELYAKLTGKT